MLHVFQVLMEWVGECEGIGFPAYKAVTNERVRNENKDTTTIETFCCKHDMYTVQVLSEQVSA